MTSVDGIKRPAHGKEFAEFCGKLGLHVVPNVGSHYQVADADSPFGRLMKSMGITRPNDVPRAEGEKTDWFRPKKEKGKSTLSKWSCGCQNVRVGTQEFYASCLVCGNTFVKVDKESQTIYKAR